MLAYLSLDITCSSKLTVFFELRARNTVGYEMIIAISAPRNSLAILGLVSKACSWNNCYQEIIKVRE